MTDSRLSINLLRTCAVGTSVVLRHGTPVAVPQAVVAFFFLLFFLLGDLEKLKKLRKSKKLSAMTSADAFVFNF